MVAVGGAVHGARGDAGSSSPPDAADEGESAPVRPLPAHPPPKADRAAREVADEARASGRRESGSGVAGGGTPAEPPLSLEARAAAAVSTARGGGGGRGGARDGVKGRARQRAQRGAHRGGVEFTHPPLRQHGAIHRPLDDEGVALAKGDGQRGFGGRRGARGGAAQRVQSRRERDAVEAHAHFRRGFAPLFDGGVRFPRRPQQHGGGEAGSVVHGVGGEEGAKAGVGGRVNHHSKHAARADAATLPATRHAGRGGGGGGAVHNLQREVGARTRPGDERVAHVAREGGGHGTTVGRGPRDRGPPAPQAGHGVAQGGVRGVALLHGGDVGESRVALAQRGAEEGVGADLQEERTVGNGRDSVREQHGARVGGGVVGGVSEGRGGRVPRRKRGGDPVGRAGRGGGKDLGDAFFEITRQRL